MSDDNISARSWADLNLRINQLRDDLKTMAGRFEEQQIRVHSLETRLSRCASVTADTPDLDQSYPGMTYIGEDDVKYLLGVSPVGAWLVVDGLITPVREVAPGVWHFDESRGPPADVPR